MLKEYLILASILTLLSLGFLISLRSGEVRLNTTEGRRTALDNLSRALLRVMGYLAGLVAVQRFVGFPMELPW